MQIRLGSLFPLGATWGTESVTRSVNGLRAATRWSRAVESDRRA